MKIWCPKCGSEDVSPITKDKHSSSGKLIIAILLILIGCLYFCVAYIFKDGLDVVNRSQIMDAVAGILIVLGFLLCFFGGSANFNYHCNHCGKNFLHK